MSAQKRSPGLQRRPGWQAQTLVSEPFARRSDESRPAPSEFLSLLFAVRRCKRLGRRRQTWSIPGPALQTVRKEKCRSEAEPQFHKSLEQEVGHLLPEHSYRPLVSADESFLPKL